MSAANNNHHDTQTTLLIIQFRLELQFVASFVYCIGEIEVSWCKEELQFEIVSTVLAGRVKCRGLCLSV